MAPAQNHLIARLPRTARTRLLALCEPVQLALGEVLCEPSGPVRHAYFPIGGSISLVARVDEHRGLEVGMVGHEGMFGAPLALGVAFSPWGAAVQSPGASWRLDVAAFKAELAASAPLRQQIDHYLYVLTAQTVAAAGCMRFHVIAARLARWLLMSQDRAFGDQLQVTHEALALLLGVRRVGVTVAASQLQKLGLISYRRGALTVLDRSGLQATACSCYASDRAVYAAHVR